MGAMQFVVRQDLRGSHQSHVELQPSNGGKCIVQSNVAYLLHPHPTLGDQGGGQGMPPPPKDRPLRTILRPMAGLGVELGRK